MPGRSASGLGVTMMAGRHFAGPFNPAVLLNGRSQLMDFLDDKYLLIWTEDCKLLIDQNQLAE